MANGNIEAVEKKVLKILTQLESPGGYKDLVSRLPNVQASDVHEATWRLLARGNIELTPDRKFRVVELEGQKAGTP